jgi:hypothetical protein
LLDKLSEVISVAEGAVGYMWYPKRNITYYKEICTVESSLIYDDCFFDMKLGRIKGRKYCKELYNGKVEDVRIDQIGIFISLLSSHFLSTLSLLSFSFYFSSSSSFLFPSPYSLIGIFIFLLSSHFLSLSLLSFSSTFPLLLLFFFHLPIH